MNHSRRAPVCLFAASLDVIRSPDGFDPAWPRCLRPRQPLRSCGLRQGQHRPLISLVEDLRARSWPRNSTACSLPCSSRHDSLRASVIRDKAKPSGFLHRRLPQLHCSDLPVAPRRSIDATLWTIFAALQQSVLAPAREKPRQELRRAHAVHAPVDGGQARESRRAAVLPHGRLLRAVLRRRGRWPAANCN